MRKGQYSTACAKRPSDCMKRRMIVVFLTLCVAVSGAAWAWNKKMVEFDLPSGVHLAILEEPIRLMHNMNCQIGSVPPKAYVKSITASFRGHSWDLSSSCMFDAVPDRALVITGSAREFGGGCDENGNCVLRGIFADEPNSYVAEWRITKGIATRTVLSADANLVASFRKQIEPSPYAE
jgi:hypothetical protein